MCTAPISESFDDRGQEDPYFLSIPHGESNAETRPSEILERSFVSGHFTQLVIHVTDKPLLEANHVPVSSNSNPSRGSTPKSDFMFWVETSVSDDAHQWRIVDRRSPISRFRRRGSDQLLPNRPAQTLRLIALKPHSLLHVPFVYPIRARLAGARAEGR
jgi:hypothetical protein